MRWGKERKERKLREENLYEKYNHPCKYTVWFTHTHTHIYIKSYLKIDKCSWNIESNMQYTKKHTNTQQLKQQHTAYPHSIIWIRLFVPMFRVLFPFLFSRMLDVLVNLFAFDKNALVSQQSVNNSVHSISIDKSIHVLRYTVIKFQHSWNCCKAFLTRQHISTWKCFICNSYANTSKYSQQLWREQKNRKVFKLNWF